MNCMCILASDIPFRVTLFSKINTSVWFMEQFFSTQDLIVTADMEDQSKKNKLISYYFGILRCLFPLLQIELINNPDLSPDVH